MEILQEKTEADSLTEVIRKALQVYDFLIEEREHGCKTILRDDNGNEREVVLI